MPHLYMLYVYILKWGFHVVDVQEENGTYTVYLEKWLHPSYEDRRFLEERIVLMPNQDAF